MKTLGLAAVNLIWRGGKEELLSSLRVRGQRSGCRSRSAPTMSSQPHNRTGLNRDYRFLRTDNRRDRTENDFHRTHSPGIQRRTVFIEPTISVIEGRIIFIKQTVARIEHRIIFIEQTIAVIEHGIVLMERRIGGIERRRRQSADSTAYAVGQGHDAAVRTPESALTTAQVR